MTDYLIRDWDEHFETSESKKVKVLGWVPIPNRTGEGYYELVDAHGAAGLGVWVAIVQAASRRHRDQRDGHPGNIRTISRQAGRQRIDAGRSALRRARSSAADGVPTAFGGGSSPRPTGDILRD